MFPSRTLRPSIVALGVSAAIFGLSGVLSAARAETPTCEKQIVSITQSANQQADATKKDEVLKILQDAKDELADEGDEDDCLSQVEKAKKLLGL